MTLTLGSCRIDLLDNPSADVTPTQAETYSAMRRLCALAEGHASVGLLEFVRSQGFLSPLPLESRLRNLEKQGLIRVSAV
jgi:hypothetical protein